MTITSTDKAAMGRLAHFAKYFGYCEEWAEADGRPVYSMETRPEDLAYIIADNVFAVTFTREADGRFVYREFDAAAWDAEEERLCEIAVAAEDKEAAEAEAQDAREAAGYIEGSAVDPRD